MRPALITTCPSTRTYACHLPALVEANASNQYGDNPKLRSFDPVVQEKSIWLPMSSAGLYSDGFDNSDAFRACTMPSKLEAKALRTSSTGPSFGMRYYTHRASSPLSANGGPPGSTSSKAAHLTCHSMLHPSTSCTTSTTTSATISGALKAGICARSRNATKLDYSNTTTASSRLSNQPCGSPSIAWSRNTPSPSSRSQQMAPRSTLMPRWKAGHKPPGGWMGRPPPSSSSPRTPLRLSRISCLSRDNSYTSTITCPPNLRSTPRWNSFGRSKHADLPQEAWKRIFGFVKAYVPKGAINLPRLQLSQWDNTLNKFKAHAARGPDGYGRLDLINMPPQLKQAHLDLLHRIEHGEQWPQQLLSGHAHGLAKCVEAEEVSQYRPIIILSMIYRTWSSIRARQGLQQLEQLMDCPAFGFLPTREAQEIWLPCRASLNYEHNNRSHWLAASPTWRKPSTTCRGARSSRLPNMLGSMRISSRHGIASCSDFRDVSRSGTRWALLSFPTVDTQKAAH